MDSPACNELYDSTNLDEVHICNEILDMHPDIHINVDVDSLWVDMSYYIFYRYYATFNWLKKFQKLDIQTCDIMENELFMEKYPKLFERTLCDLVKNSKVKWEMFILSKIVLEILFGEMIILIITKVHVMINWILLTRIFLNIHIIL